MKRDFTHENFEDFLKRSADNFRMKAPDKVWQNLSKELHKRRRRFIIGLSAFLLISSAVGYYTISNISQSSGTSSEQFKQPNTKQANTSKQQTNNSVKGEVDKRPSLNPIVTSTNSNGLNAINNRNIVKTSDLLKNENLFNNGSIDKTKNNVSLLSDEALNNNFASTIIDSYDFEHQQESIKNETKQPVTAISNTLPLTIESVINSYKIKIKKSKLEAQFYFAPSISYRKLTENKSYLRSVDMTTAIPANYPALNSSVNSNVTHKPDVGFEMGLTAKYQVSNKLKIRSGLQFNVNRYDVKAFSSPLSLATITLNTNGPRVDSFYSISSYSNVNGYKSNWLQNLYFQVSAPIGVEYALKKTDKMQFGVAATIQPTYVLGDRAYLISTDYKSYTQIPWLVRRWNVNTSFEAFVNYKRLQFGPQVRYQLLSSFISKYPVKENLFDFGMKLGVSLGK